MISQRWRDYQSRLERERLELLASRWDHEVRIERIKRWCAIGGLGLLAALVVGVLAYFVAGAVQ